MNDSLEQLFSFATLMEALKKIERYKGQFYWRDYPQLARYESVADHTWRMSILLVLFADRLQQKIDLEKALKMVILHDVPEIIAGDQSPQGEDGTGKKTSAFDKKLADDRHQKEKQAAKDLFSGLPSDKGDELFSIWESYEKQDSFEAKVVKAIDKLECLLQIWEYRKGHMFKPHHDFNVAYTTPYFKVDPILERFGDLIVQKMTENFRDFEGSAKPVG